LPFSRIAQAATVDVNIDLDQATDFKDLEVRVNGLLSTTTLRFDGDQVRAMSGNGYAWFGRIEHLRNWRYLGIVVPP
jgi:hypothetical protein